MNLDQLLCRFPPAILALADGTLFSGFAIGAAGEAVGEVVFNTAMTGYQEILTDPSYASQIVTFTYPHIGNVGINAEDRESSKVWAAGLVVRDLSLIVSNWRSQQSLSSYLQAQNIVAIAGIDTRALTHILRTKGAQNGCIINQAHLTLEEQSTRALQKARTFKGLNNVDLAQVVSTSTLYPWSEKTYSLNPSKISASQNANYHIVVYDFGVKFQILRLLVNQGCRVTVVPAKTSAEEVMRLNPHGIVLANGPGDPAACDYAIENTRLLLKKAIPLFGICLGFQILALAYGAKTKKMKFGHHGANHPVKDLRDGTVYITSQNHGFCVDENTLPNTLAITHISLFDGSLQGFEQLDQSIFAFQGHPEASPGPHDIVHLFDRFINKVKQYAQAN